MGPINSANQEVRQNHQALVRRSRDLARNDAHARRFLGLQEVNVVGAHGIRLQCQVRDSAGELDRQLNKEVERAWREWCQPENCTTDGSLDFNGVQRTMVRGEARDGEWLARMVPGADNAFGFALQLLDPDQLDVDYNETAGRDRNEIRMGVELNRWGKPIAFHFWNEHPSEHGRSRKRERVPASQVLHYYEATRPGQIRGVPRFANILSTLRMLHGYREAEVVAARTAAAKMGFFEVDPEAVDDPLSAASDEELEITAEPGSFGKLPAGHKFVPWDPQHPTSAFDSFEKAILRTIATGLDTSYASLAGDLSDVNYSSIRAGLLVERDFYRSRQTDLACRILRRIYLEWVKWAVTTGAVQVSPLRLNDLRAHAWRARGWPWVDPKKDVEAALMAIDGRLDSRSRVVAEMGRDFEETLEEIRDEEELAAELGVELSRTEAAPASPDDDDEESPFGRKKTA